MFFFKKKSKLELKQQVTDLTSRNRKAVEEKLNELISVDAQLSQLINETKNMTLSLREKLGGYLKITRNTIKSICQNLREGVVLIDYQAPIKS